MAKVLIVGAGPSGLVALKEMLDQGLEAMVVEKAASFGGVFRPSNPAVYDELFLTTSNYFMAFSDFPPPETALRYSSKQAYQDYLRAYIEHFELARHVHFETQVVGARFCQTKRSWEVEVIDGEGQRRLAAETLIVATGSQQVPLMPRFEGYTGEVVHGSAYRGREPFAGKRVLVVGVGESASDIAAEIAEVAAETVVWSRRPFIIAPRFPVASMSPGYDEHAILSEAPESLAKVNDLLELLSTSRMANWLPMIGYSLVRIPLFAAIRALPFVSEAAKINVRWNDVAIDRNHWMQDQSAVVTKTMRLPVAAAAGKLSLVIAPSVGFDGTRVEFEAPLLDDRPAGAGEDFDCIVACTGYQTQLPWLEDEVELDPRAWFRHCLPPGHGGRLAFLGWARPHQGGIPACAEILARYIALVASGEATLPANLDERVALEAERERAYYCASPNVGTLVDYPAFMDSMAGLVGCLPRMPHPLREPKRFAQYWVYPNWPCWYRKDGHGRAPGVLDQVLDSVEIARGPALPLVVIHALLLMLSAPIHALDRLLASPRSPGPPLRRGWKWRQPKITLLHGNREA